MDPRMYNAAMNGDFSLDEHLRRDEENGYQVTPNGNTILHVASLFGRQGFVREVLKITPGLLCYKNKKNETALHIAANVGQSEVVHELLSITGEKTILVRMIDHTGDTALHKAVRSGHIDIVRILMESIVDPKLDFPTNKAGETPLYLAAESGFYGALIEILNVCEEPTYVAGPFKRTPLHAAVIQKHKECARSLWQRNNHLCEEADELGWNSLHYAVKQGCKDLVSDMLEWKKSLAYLPAGSENDWTTTFHIAASVGDISMIHELLKHCPDCWDMVNSIGQNALHVAILNHQEILVNELLELTSCKSLVDEADNEGNTPLHLLAANWNHLPKSILLNHQELLVHVLIEISRCNSLADEADNEGNTPLHLLAASWDRLPKSILDHPRAKKMTFNKQNQTPLDIALSRTWTTSKKLVDDLCSINGQVGHRDLKENLKTKMMEKIQQMRKEEMEKIQQMRREEEKEMEKIQQMRKEEIQQMRDEEMEKIQQMRKEEEEEEDEEEIKIGKIMKAAQIQLVVATLVMTVTFTAGFTLPGGLESDDGPNKGAAILLKSAAFRAFVISDVLAFACSAGAVFIYFFMAHTDVFVDNNETNVGFKLILWKCYKIAAALQLFAMGAVVVAFVTGMYATLQNSLPLAVSVCVIGCVSYLMYYCIIIISIYKTIKELMDLIISGFEGLSRIRLMSVLWV